MAKQHKTFVCQNCGATTPRWAGKCEACGEWNTIIEEAPRENLPKGVSGGKGGRKIEFVDLKGASAPPPRRSTTIAELDRVCGGGLVAGSVILVGGDPGIGKSTLLLQATGLLAANSVCVYVTGEESV